jgi:hypothetical protein
MRVELLGFYIMLIIGCFCFLASVWNMFVLMKQRQHEKKGDFGECKKSFSASRSSKVGIGFVQLLFIGLLVFRVKAMMSSKAMLEKTSNPELQQLIEETIQSDIAMIVLLVGIILLYSTKVIRVWRRVSIYDKGIMSKGAFHSFYSIGEVTGDGYSTYLHFPDAKLKGRLSVNVSTKEASTFLAEAKDAEKAFKKRTKSK